jgi:5-methylcytosine-specific restriction endonuclease McrA
MWVGTVEMGISDTGKRLRRTVSSKDREAAEAKLQAINTTRWVKPPTRAELMAEARKLGTHTGKEWGKKVAATKNCRYCKTKLNMFNMVKDHMIAVESGGSDSIDNIQPICWECNSAKSTTPPDEYTYKGDGPRTFKVFPTRREMYERMMAAKRSAHFRMSA